jgi:hypothetical protein
MSLFVDYHAKQLVPKIPSYLQDTPDLLRKLEKWKTVSLPEDLFLVSIDVVGLYTNIPHDEGLDTFKEALDKREDKTVTTDLLVEMLSKVLKTNIFEFNEGLYLQNLGQLLVPEQCRHMPIFSWKKSITVFKSVELSKM